MTMGALLFASTLVLDCEKIMFRDFHRKNCKNMGDRKKTRRETEEKRMEEIGQERSERKANLKVVLLN